MFEELNTIEEEKKTSKKESSNVSSEIVKTIRDVLLASILAFVIMISVVSLTGSTEGAETTKHEIDYNIYKDSNIVLWDDTTVPTEEGITLTVYRMLDDDKEYLLFVTSEGTITVEEIRWYEKNIS